MREQHRATDKTWNPDTVKDLLYIGNVRGTIILISEQCQIKDFLPMKIPSNLEDDYTPVATATYLFQM